MKKNKIEEFIFNYGLYIFAIVCCIISGVFCIISGLIKQEKSGYIIAIIWVVNSAFERSNSLMYRKMYQEEFSRGLQLALYSDKIHSRDYEKILKLNNELSKYRKDFKAKRRWKV